MAIFGAKPYSEPTYNEWVERGHNKKGRKKERKKEEYYLYVYFCVTFLRIDLYGAITCSEIVR